jgi:hypothetical protein
MSTKKNISPKILFLQWQLQVSKTERWMHQSFELFPSKFECKDFSFLSGHCGVITCRNTAPLVERAQSLCLEYQSWIFVMYHGTRHTFQIIIEDSGILSILLGKAHSIRYGASFGWWCEWIEAMDWLWISICWNHSMFPTVIKWSTSFISAKLKVHLSVWFFEKLGKDCGR